MERRTTSYPNLQYNLVNTNTTDGQNLFVLSRSLYVPHYTTCHTSIVATGKQGSAPGELFYPCGVAIHEETHQIFVANRANDRIEIFSETGEFFHQLGVG